MSGMWETVGMMDWKLTLTLLGIAAGGGAAVFAINKAYYRIKRRWSENHAAAFVAACVLVALSLFTGLVVGWQRDRHHNCFVFNTKNGVSPTDAANWCHGT